MNTRLSSAETVFLLLANVLVLGIVAYAFVLESSFADFYYFSVQEDEYVEWSSFWAFILACVVFARRASDYRSSAQAFPWFLYGVALFCLLVAMEEISWGQRILGYRPPEYFLTENYQQELNFHNIVDTDYRKLALTLVICCYGIALPLAASNRRIRTLLQRVGIVAPSAGLLPAFAGALFLYLVYPWSHSGEWVELMLGLGFLFGAIKLPCDFKGETRSSDFGRSGATTSSVIAFVAVIGLGLLTAAASRAQRFADPELLEAARIEVAAIARDFETGYAESRCNLHKRLYTFVVEYDQASLYVGSFADLRSQGLHEDRLDFFLDPWNSPYWIRDRCERQGGIRTSFVYSFGPNRRRDSSPDEILGDDIGAHFSAR